MESLSHSNEISQIMKKTRKYVNSSVSRMFAWNSKQATDDKLWRLLREGVSLFSREPQEAYSLTELAYGSPVNWNMPFICLRSDDMFEIRQPASRQIMQNKVDFITCMCLPRRTSDKHNGDVS